MGSCFYKMVKDANQNAASSERVGPDPYGNIALFEKTRNKTKFALSFVENYYPYVYWCGEAWTTGDGLTVLYEADGSSAVVTPDTKVPTLKESDEYKNNYMTFEILPDIAKLVRVPMDENTLIAACVLRYCIGHENFKKSMFLKYLNAGKKGAELAKTLTGWRKQEGVPKRCYFFAAIMVGKMEFSDLLGLRAEGCYLLDWEDIFTYSNGGVLKVDRDSFCKWNFSNLQQNLKIARRQKVTPLNLGNNARQLVRCEFVQNVVSDSILKIIFTPEELSEAAILVTSSANAQNDSSYIAYQRGDYATALRAAERALKLAETDKQYGAAYYNLGMAYLATGKYADAIECLKQSLGHNKTQAAQKALEEAENNPNTSVPVGLVLCIIVSYALWRWGRRQYFGPETTKTR